MLLRQVFDPKLAQYAYLIGCQRTGEALVIDPERDVDRYLHLAREEGLRITAVAETHIHADFLSGARELAEAVGAKLYLSDEGGPDWSYEWAKQGDYDVTLLHDGDSFRLGGIEIQAVHTPGHTPEHLSFLVFDRGSGASEPIGIASGDFVFVGDLGRPDLLESAAGLVGQRDPSARRLFHSVDRFLTLPDFVQVWPGHGAGSACGKALGAVPSSTVGYEKRHNAALDAARRGEEAFVEAILEGQPEPPLYFANMKRLNKLGPPVLGEVPTAEPLENETLLEVLTDSRTVVVDTRRDRAGFMEGHLAGALHAPLDRSFPAVVGSYVQPEDDIVLVVDEERAEEAIRDLIRIGFDSIRGQIAPARLTDPLLAQHLRSIPVVDFAEAEIRRQQSAVTGPPVTLLDVRGASEHGAGAIPGALNIAHTRLLDRLAQIPANGELWVYCRSGARAASAVSALSRAGFDVTLVDDDFERWQQRAA